VGPAAGPAPFCCSLGGCRYSGFVTDDRKEAWCWWWKAYGKMFGPRHELVAEMHHGAGVCLYMYPATAS
jgi:hypothetical protein